MREMLDILKLDTRRTTLRVRCYVSLLRCGVSAN